MREALHIWPEEILQHPDGNFTLTIRLRVESGAEPKIRTNELEQLCPKLTGKLRISVGDNNLGHAMEAEHMINE